MFSASLLLSCTSSPVFALDFSDIFAKSSTKFLLIIFLNNSILESHWPLLHDAKIISLIDQIDSVLHRSPHYSQQSYRDETWCDEQAAGGWLMSYWATKSCDIGSVLNCVEQKKKCESSNNWQKTTLKSLNFLRADHYWCEWCCGDGAVTDNALDGIWRTGRRSNTRMPVSCSGNVIVTQKYELLDIWLDKLLWNPACVAGNTCVPLGLVCNFSLVQMLRWSSGWV